MNTYMETSPKLNDLADNLLVSASCFKDLAELLVNTKLNNYLADTTYNVCELLFSPNGISEDQLTVSEVLLEDNIRLLLKEIFSIGAEFEEESIINRSLDLRHESNTEKVLSYIKYVISGLEIVD